MQVYGEERKSEEQHIEELRKLLDEPGKLMPMTYTAEEVNLAAEYAYARGRLSIYDSLQSFERRKI